MDTNRKTNGQFGPNNRANPNGRGRKRRSLVDEMTRELEAKVTITENGKRKRVSKLAANAKQIANQGASGELKAAKMAIDLALKAEKEREAPAPSPILTDNDKTIVMRFIERLKLNNPATEHPDAPAQP